MIRLFVAFGVAARWAEIGVRVRGATIAVGPDQGPVATSDAFLFERSNDVEPALIEPLLSIGKHVLVLGHPDWSPAAKDALLRVARQAGAQLSIVNLDRYLPSRRLIKQQIVDRLAPVGLMRSRRWEPADAHVQIVAGLPARLVDDLDQVMWLGGQSVERVFAVQQAPSEPMEHSGRYVQLHLALKQGTALLDYTDRLPAGDDYRALSVIGFSGAAYADDHQNMQLLYLGGRAQAIRAGEELTAQATAVQDFVDALADGREVSHTALGWQPVLDVADAVNRSLASGRAISLEGD